MEWRLDIDLEKLNLLSDPQLLDAVAEMAESQIANIQRRMMRGIGIDDQPLPGYSEGYAAYREKRGRTSQIRTLNLTGSMQRALYLRRVGITGEGNAFAEVAFSTRAEAEKAFHTNQQTPWFGVSPLDERALARTAELRLAEIIGRK